MYRRALWIFVALTFSSFAVSFLRVNIGVIHIPYPVLGMGLILLGWIFSLCLRPGSLLGPLFPPDFRILGLLCFLFLTWHLTSMLLSGGLVEPGYIAPSKQTFKIAAGLGLFWVTVLLFPRDPRFLERFWHIVLWSSMPLLGYLIFRSLSIGNHFLSSLNTFDDPTFMGGRNQVAWYVAIIVQYAFWAFQQKGRRLVVLVPLVVTSFSLIYSVSRTAWIVASVGLLYVPLSMLIFDVKKAAKILTVMMVIGLLLVAGGIWVVSEYGDISELSLKFRWFFSPEDVPELNSFETRWHRVRDALGGFLVSPIIGLGVRNFSYLVSSGTPHNDYAAILAELGLIGEVLFLGILLMIGKFCLRRPKFAKETNWPSIASRGAFWSLLIGSAFMDMYTMPHYWIFAGLFVVGREIEERQLVGKGLLREGLRPTTRGSTTPGPTVTSPELA